MKDTTTTAPARTAPPAPPAPETTALYELAAAQIEIDGLICYRTHRLRLTPARAAQINSLFPDGLTLIGV